MVKIKLFKMLMQPSIITYSDLDHISQVMLATKVTIMQSIFMKCFCTTIMTCQFCSRLSSILHDILSGIEVAIWLMVQVL